MKKGLPPHPLSKTLREEYVSFFSGKDLRHSKKQKKAAEQQCKSLWSISAASQKPSPLLHSSLLLIHLGLLRMRQPLRPLSKTSDEVDENIVLQISSTEQERKERHRIPREDDILSYEEMAKRRARFNHAQNNLSCLPPGGRGTTTWWKEPAGMKATICLL